MGEAAARRPIWDGAQTLRLRAWALAHGQVVQLTALDAVLQARDDGGEAVTGRWTRAGVEHLLWAGVVAGCRRRGQPVPEQVAETLWALLGHLEATGQLAAGSDELAVLRDPLVAYGGLGTNGRPRPAGGRRVPRPRPGQHDALAVVLPLPDRPEGAAPGTGARRRGRSRGLPRAPLLRSPGP